MEISQLKKTAKIIIARHSDEGTAQEISLCQKNVHF